MIVLTPICRAQLASYELPAIWTHNPPVVGPPLGLAGLVSVEVATERLVACLPEDHPLARRKSLSVADVFPEPIVAAPVSPGPCRDYWILTDYR